MHWYQYTNILTNIKTPNITHFIIIILYYQVLHILLNNHNLYDGYNKMYILDTGY